MLIIIDRLQQLMMMSLGALASGTAAGRSVRSAVWAGALTALGLWLVELLITAVLMVALPGARGERVYDILISLFAGPMPGYLLALPVGWSLLAMVLTLVLREVIMRALWTLVLFNTRQYSG